MQLRGSGSGLLVKLSQSEGAGNKGAPIPNPSHFAAVGWPHRNLWRTPPLRGPHLHSPRALEAACEPGPQRFPAHCGVSGHAGPPSATLAGGAQAVSHRCGSKQLVCCLPLSESTPTL